MRMYSFHVFHQIEIPFPFKSDTMLKGSTKGTYLCMNKVSSFWLIFFFGKSILQTYSTDFTRYKLLQFLSSTFHSYVCVWRLFTDRGDKYVFLCIQSVDNIMFNLTSWHSFSVQICCGFDWIHVIIMCWLLVTEGIPQSI